MKPSTLPSASLLAVFLFTLGGCEPWPEPPPVDHGAFEEDHEAWRVEREGRSVTPPGGPVLWVGLWLLPEGETAIGTDPSLPVVLPDPGAPARVGVLRREGMTVTLDPAPGSGLVVHEGPEVASAMVLQNDRQDEPTRLALGTLGLRVHAEPGTDRLWLRAWDEAHPLRETFRLPDYYQVDPTWRVQARYEAYEEPAVIRLPDVTGGMVEFRAPGELVFRRDGRERRLIATATETSTSFFVMLRDATADVDTYQGGRYLRVPFPDETGWTTIDFNRAYNPPCVFTGFSVCALPPRQNWLELAVTAGEKRPEKEALAS